MEAADLKLEFEKQVKDTDVKIADAEKQLAQLKEYKVKLLGGLETIELLKPASEENKTNPNEAPEDVGTGTVEPTITDIPPVDSPSTES